MHELAPHPSYFAVVHAESVRPLGEAIAGQRRDDHVEPTVSQQVGDGQVLDEGTRPAVRQDDWCAIAGGCPPMDEMDARALNLGGELRVAVEACLRRAPI